MACSNCYNGCTEITSDKCVKYTGVDVPVLGIQTGDSLSYVEQALIEFLTSTLDGTGIKPVIDPEIICELVSQYLPTCQDLTATDLFKALIQATCSLQEQIVAIEAQLEALEADYNVECLDGVTNSSNTHNVLQAVINKLCELEVDLAALAVDLDANYVKLADLDTLIQAYLDSIPGGGSQQYLKMVPYTAVEYYGPLSNFDSTGKGLAALGWDKIYLCNGANNTPDKRGRSPIGAIQGVQSTAPLSPIVDPLFGNFNYEVWPGGNSTNGTNKVTLTSAQMPVHNHTAVININDPGHSHSYTQRVTNNFAQFSSDEREVTTWTSTASTTGTGFTGLNSNNVTANINTAGQGQAHDNVHPVLACNYIIYLP